MPQPTQAKARKHNPCNLSQAEAIELGTKIGALTGLGIEGGEGMKTAIPQARHPER
jgi:hypothetical protein